MLQMIDCICDTALSTCMHDVTKSLFSGPFREITVRLPSFLNMLSYYFSDPKRRSNPPRIVNSNCFTKKHGIIACEYFPLTISWQTLKAAVGS